ncbi:right-handed parallel beta-helix repeat-containing protein [Salibacterium lacus]|uniref:Right-handed parallel beta-helix repeat-containing protein n=1 Tax=Salibacterium lacus TaxID=1898109 RepID=A0ABW5T637_9BACI
MDMRKRKKKTVGLTYALGTGALVFAVWGSPSSALAFDETYEAEDAYFQDAETAAEHNGYTGSGFVDYTPNEPGGYIEWQINAPSSGTYRLHFRYAHGGSDGDRPAEVEVNGSLIDRNLAFVPTDGWGDWGYTGLNANLEEGSNTIRLTGVGEEGGANIDHLWIENDSSGDDGDDDDNSGGSGDAYYVAVDGSDSSSGSESNPFATIDHAVDTVDAGDTIYLRGGTYQLGETIDLEADGTSSEGYHLLAYDGESPILDFSEMEDDDGNRGIEVHGDYWHLKGFTVQGAGDNGMFVDGSNNLIEELDVRENQDSGIQLHTGASDNTVRNVDSYYNYDPGDHGENADGFAAKFDTGSGNVFEGCRAWNNSDDGYDFWKANAAITVKDTWVFRNGVNTWGDSDFQGDGNGIKLGRGDGNHTIERALIWENPGNGVNHNKHAEAVNVYHVTAYANATLDSGKNNFQFSDSEAEHVLRNNVSHDGPVSSMDDVDDEYNSWNLSVDVSDSDFISLNDNEADGPRSADGSLPETDFLKLDSGSDLIDAGTDIGLSYEGSAPDLGAYEKE